MCEWLAHGRDLTTCQKSRERTQFGLGAPATVIAVACREGTVVPMRSEQCRESQRQVDIAHGSA
jgi:hypothetical protein